jgi:hypothetical protein
MKESGAEMKWKLPSLNAIFQRGDQPADRLPADADTRSTFRKVWEVIRILCLAIYRLRSVFLAIPVIIVALRLAAYNSDHLPLMVGLDLQTNGEFAKTISRETAVSFPLFLTGGCLVLTFLSKKTLYPWLISVFTLVIPILLLVTNMYPA